MKYLFTLSIVFFFFNTFGQNDWKKGSRGSLEFEYPNNWDESEYLATSTNISYGAQFFALGETAEFSVIEIPNDTGINDAHSISNDDIKNLVLNIFSPQSQFYEIKDSTIANLNSKFVDANAITSQGLKVYTKLHLVFSNNKMIIIQGNYTSKNQEDYTDLFREIFDRLKFK